MTIAITLIAGAALFGYVNDEAATNERQYGAAVGGTVNFLNERFAVVNMAFPPGTNSITLWLYNSGQVALQVAQITLSNSNTSCGCELSLAYPGAASSTSTATAASGSFCVEDGITQQIGASQIPSTEPALSGVSIAVGSNPLGITIVLPVGCTLSSGSTYSVNVLGIYGNDVVYYSEYTGGS